MHKESEYTIYKSININDLVSDEIFDYFKLNRKDCQIELMKLSPGKMRIPHKDYYINYKYRIINNNGNFEYIPKDFEEEPNVTRLWITLTEPCFGHILIVEDKSFYWLDQGSIVTWKTPELHTAANLGYEDRFIMTITGSALK